MSSKRLVNLKKKHLLLCFDAFGTLYHPRTSIPATYAKCAGRYGISGIKEDELASSFKKGNSIRGGTRIVTKQFLQLSSSRPMGFQTTGKPYVCLQHLPISQTDTIIH